ncbi:hypothetical protein DFH09DRAFT_1368525 [Mycena vulgaris]|nr:hypothetical protein DFH09DRAFT_1368525 [Mycena vulgaris]
MLITDRGRLVPGAPRFRFCVIKLESIESRSLICDDPSGLGLDSEDDECALRPSVDDVIDTRRDDGGILRSAGTVASDSPRADLVCAPARSPCLCRPRRVPHGRGRTSDAVESAVDDESGTPPSLGVQDSHRARYHCGLVPPALWHAASLTRLAPRGSIVVPALSSGISKPGSTSLWTLAALMSERSARGFVRASGGGAGGREYWYARAPSAAKAARSCSRSRLSWAWDMVHEEDLDCGRRHALVRAPARMSPGGCVRPFRRADVAAHALFIAVALGMRMRSVSAGRSGSVKRGSSLGGVRHPGVRASVGEDARASWRADVSFRGLVCVLPEVGADGGGAAE